MGPLNLNHCSCCLGVCVCVLKGTAVFWYNLFPSGEGDYNTRHAACPVLVGNKWGKTFLQFNLGLCPVSFNIDQIITDPSGCEKWLTGA